LKGQKSRLKAGSRQGAVVLGEEAASPHAPAMGSGERCKLPQRGAGELRLQTHSGHIRAKKTAKTLSGEILLSPRYFLLAPPPGIDATGGMNAWCFMWIVGWHHGPRGRCLSAVRQLSLLFIISQHWLSPPILLYWPLCYVSLQSF